MHNNCPLCGKANAPGEFVCDACGSTLPAGKSALEAEAFSRPVAPPVAKVQNKPLPTKSNSRKPGAIIVSAFVIGSFLLVRILVGFGTVSVDAGTFIAESIDERGPGDAAAMQCLASLIKTKPNASKYIVRWKNAYPSVSTFRKTLEYDHSARTLWFHGEMGSGVHYGNVTEAIIAQTAASNEDVQKLKAHGATHVRTQR